MQTFADPLARAVQVAGDKIAVISEDRQFSHKELNSRCRRLADVLISKRVKPGDRVAVLAANTNHHIECYVAIPAAGFAVVPLNTRHAEPELRYAIEDAGATILISDRDPGSLRDIVDTVIMIPDEFDALVAAADEAELGVGISEDTLAGLFYTGGTTGASKGVMLTHRNLIANTFHFMTAAPPVEDSVFLIMAPLFHAAGSNGVLGGVWTGSCQIPLKVFNPATALDLIEKHKVTHTLGVPTMIAAIAELQHAEPRNTSSLVMVAHGGSPIATEVVRRAAEAFPTAEFVHVYGMTEASPLVTGLRNEQRLLDVDRSRSCGQSLIGVQVKIIDNEGDELPIGEVGELAARGPNIMKGYWNKPEQSAEVLVDGWYRSGDMGYMDDEGFVFLVDRAKDMIVSGGENVYCSEVEEALYKHPAVLEAAVFGVPDEAWGEAVHAFVVPREDVTSEELIEFCREHIAGYKLPKAITLSSEELPKSGPGKILKRELREPFWEGHERKVN
ncbi:MAG: long-chain-fatty-acid--CoA ligase [Woeseiaceae bacterium]|nr:long-chain-fatty-acid--CoA ligase [Woeseiaceae bacterium]